MDREQIVELLKSLGLSDEQIAETSEETLEAVAKAITDDPDGDGLTVDEFKAIAQDEQATAAFDSGDVEGFVGRVQAVLKSMDEDEDDAGGVDPDLEDEDDDEDDDDDMGDADDGAASETKRKADEILDKLRAAKSGKQATKVRKSLADFMAVDEIGDADEQYGMALVAKAIQDYVEQEAGDLRRQVKQLHKSLGEAQAQITKLQRQPAGRALPYTLGEAEAPAPVADKGVTERIIKAQAAGYIPAADAMRMLEAAKGDPAAVEQVAKRLDAAEKANTQQ